MGLFHAWTLKDSLQALKIKMFHHWLAVWKESRVYTTLCADSCCTMTFVLFSDILDLCDSTSNSKESVVDKAPAKKRMSELEKYVQEKRQAAAAKRKNTDMDDSEEDLEGDNGDEMTGDEFDEMMEMEDDSSEYGGDDGDSDEGMMDEDDMEDFGEGIGSDDDNGDEFEEDEEESASSGEEAEDNGCGKSGRNTAASKSETSTAATSKYIPPALRAKMKSESAEQSLLSSPLMRQVKGLVNRYGHVAFLAFLPRLQPSACTKDLNQTPIPIPLSFRWGTEKECL